MAIPYRGPDATQPDHVVTLGQGDARWAGAADLSGIDSALNQVKTELFASPSRSDQPFCEVRLTTQYTNAANADALAGAGWTVYAQSPTMFYDVGAGSGNGNTTYSRMRIPFSGRWLIDFQAELGSTTAYNGAIKVMAKTGTAAPSVTADSIASDAGPSAASVEGRPLHAHIIDYFEVGTIIYWGTWRSTSGPVLVTNFGGIRTKIGAYWMGPL